MVRELTSGGLLRPFPGMGLKMARKMPSGGLLAPAVFPLAPIPIPLQEVFPIPLQGRIGKRIQSINWVRRRAPKALGRRGPKARGPEAKPRVYRGFLFEFEGFPTRSIVFPSNSNEKTFEFDVKGSCHSGLPRGWPLPAINEGGHTGGPSPL